MKRIILSLLAVAALASCSKTESAYVDQDQEIRLNPVTAISTKAYAPVYGAIDGTTYPISENFDVRAYWANEPAGSKFTQGQTIYLGTEAEAVPFTNKGQYWGGTTTYYWPKNGSLRFAAYSPATLDMAHTFATDTYAIEHTQSDNTANTVDMLIAPMTPSYNAETATENVSVVFEHALSWITIKVKAANPEAAKAFKVHDVIVNDVFTKATLNAAMADGIQYAEWGEETAKTDAADYTVYTNAHPNGQDVTVTSTTIESLNSEGEYRNGTIVIPQVPTTLTINYTQKAMPGTPELQNQTVTVPLELDDEDNNIWEPGRHYIYTVIFDLDEILINPSVADWEDVVVDDKDADDAGQIATVATEEELLTALAAVDENGNHTVTEIELHAIIPLSKQLNIDYSVAFTKGGFSGKPINVTGAVVSFNNVRFENATAANESSVYVRDGNNNITFENCFFSEYAWEAIQYTAETGKWISVTGCGFSGEAHRDLHLQVKNLSNAEVKITDNTFAGADKDSYVTIYGFQHKRMILEDNEIKDEDVTANTTNVWISDGFDENNLTLRGFVVPTTGGTLATSLSASTVLGSNYSVPSLNLAGNDLDGAGHTLTMTKGAAMFFVTAQKGFISNLNVNGYNTRNNDNKVTYGIVLDKAEGDVVINNVTSTDFAYALNTQISGTSEYTLTVVNSTLEGWTSFAGYASAKFIGTNFKIGNYFPREDADVENPWNGTVKPYITTEFVNCTFDKGFILDVTALADGAKITFDDCTVNGEKLTEANFLSYMKIDGAPAPGNIGNGRYIFVK